MKDVSFQLDTNEAAEIIRDMAMPIVKKSADAIASRAKSMASSISSDPPTFEVTTEVGTIRRGSRAIATVLAVAKDEHQNYIAYQALAKSKDAGRVN